MRRPRLYPSLLLYALLLSGLFLAVAPSALWAQASDLFISEYIEGSSNNKAIEIYNGTGVPVDLAAGNYSIQMYFNGSTSPGLTIALTGVVADGDVYVLAHSSADPAILAQADQTNGSGWFNGDDAVVLVKNGVVIDAIGQIGFDPGSQWGTGDTSTQDNTLRRNPTVCAGDTNPYDPFDPSLEWTGYPQNTFDGLGSHVAQCGGGGDTPPTVVAVSPADGAIGVPADANLTVTFSEDVTVSGTWYAITCSVSGAHSATATGGPQSFTLDPDSDFAPGESCTATLFGSQVVDQDGTPDPMAADFSWSFTVDNFGTCQDGQATPIHVIQGNGPASPLDGTPGVVIEGVVVGDFQGPSPNLRGFYVQEEDSQADGDPATSEGIFVFDHGLGVDVQVGDLVRVRGTVSEFFDLTELASIDRVDICASGQLAAVSPTPVTLPVGDLADWETLEGMWVVFPQELTVTEHFNLGRFGEVHLSSGGRLFQPTHLVPPGAPALAAQAANDRNRIVLDDASTAQNPDPIPYPAPGLSAANTLRLGDTVTGLSGVLDYRFSLYRVQPVAPVSFTHANPRPPAPEPVGGTLKVASANLLNYFVTIDDGSNNCGPSGGLECRGADSTFEFQRQRAKTVSALAALDADIIGVVEVQNDDGAALADLVAGLNDALGPGTYAYIDTGAIGTDAIKVGLIYRPATVTPVGPFAILDSSVDPTFIDTKNRPVLAQTFQENTSGERFTVAVNHLKSKGSDCNDVGDPDLGDGQGNCNGTRTAAATALVNWLATDPTGSGDPDFLIIGDLNAYAMEDPITAIKAAGFTNLLEAFMGVDAYSYVFQRPVGLPGPRARQRQPHAPSHRRHRMAHQRGRAPGAGLQRGVQIAGPGQ
ncbi:MAG: hypothetical protein KatS3mg050_3211 [Litorilinea sp.]|nr:MAG: hypothetical protein KatS3mg050_3211 [Litorilinea sp.]